MLIQAGDSNEALSARVEKCISPANAYFLDRFKAIGNERRANDE